MHTFLRKTYQGLKLSQQTLDSTRTFTINTRAAIGVILQVNLTARTAVTAILVSATGKHLVNNTLLPAGNITSVGISGGTGTRAAYTDSYAIAATGSYMLDFNVQGCDEITVSVSGTAGAAGDVVDVYAWVTNA